MVKRKEKKAGKGEKEGRVARENDLSLKNKIGIRVAARESRRAQKKKGQKKKKKSRKK